MGSASLATMIRHPQKKRPPVSCLAVSGRAGGIVFLRVRSNAGVILLRHHALDALQIAVTIRAAVASAHADSRGVIELSLLTGDALILALDVASGIADELTAGASRATGVRA